MVRLKASDLHDLWGIPLGRSYKTQYTVTYELIYCWDKFSEYMYSTLGDQTSRCEVFSLDS